MNRCIQCTRCVRFTTEIAGVPDLGAIGRGEDMEITTYLERAMGSELQGNVIDLCPVGALTSRPYEFMARPWELTKTESIDVMDAVGSSIRVDARGRDVLRILPRLNEAVNEEWISDKTRFVWDGLRTQRLDRPYVREQGKLRPASWHEAFAAIAAKVKGVPAERIGAIAGDLVSVEDLFALKALMTSLGVTSIDARQDGTNLDPSLGRASYLFNASIAGIDEADAILLVGTDPRREASVLNARLRKRWRSGPVRMALIGEASDLTYEVERLGMGGDTLSAIANGSHAFAQVLKDAKKPLIIVGQGALTRADGAAVLAMAATIAVNSGAASADWNGLAVLHTAAARAGALDLGFVPGAGGKDAAAMAKGGVDVLFNLGADEIEIAPGAFVIYQGTHGDRGAHRADVILPGAAYTEKSGTYVNTEGRVQLALRAAFPPGDAREDWAIFRALSDVLGQRLPFDSLDALRAEMAKTVPALGVEGLVDYGWSEPSLSADVIGTIADYPIKDFYLTNAICRASETMQKCSAELVHGTQYLEAAE
jgi:NADH-quinone oxidoreductase subunit G